MADSEYIPIFKLYIEFESEHDWDEVKGILEEWEQGGIEGYDGAEEAFSVKADNESRRR